MDPAGHGKNDEKSWDLDVLSEVFAKLITITAALAENSYQTLGVHVVDGIKKFSSEVGKEYGLDISPYIPEIKDKISHSTCHTFENALKRCVRNKKFNFDDSSSIDNKNDYTSAATRFFNKAIRVIDDTLKKGDGDVSTPLSDKNSVLSTVVSVLKNLVRTSNDKNTENKNSDECDTPQESTECVDVVSTESEDFGHVSNDHEGTEKGSHSDNPNSVHSDEIETMSESVTVNSTIQAFIDNVNETISLFEANSDEDNNDTPGIADSSDNNLPVNEKSYKNISDSDKNNNNSEKILSHKPVDENRGKSTTKPTDKNGINIDKASLELPIEKTKDDDSISTKQNKHSPVKSTVDLPVNNKNNKDTSKLTNINKHNVDDTKDEDCSESSEDIKLESEKSNVDTPVHESKDKKITKMTNKNKADNTKEINYKNTPEPTFENTTTKSIVDLSVEKTTNNYNSGEIKSKFGTSTVAGLNEINAKHVTKSTNKYTDNSTVKSPIGQKTDDHATDSIDKNKENISKPSDKINKTKAVEEKNNATYTKLFNDNEGSNNKSTKEIPIAKIDNEQLTESSEEDDDYSPFGFSFFPILKGLAGYIGTEKNKNDKIPATNFNNRNQIKSQTKSNTPDLHEPEVNIITETSTTKIIDEPSSGDKATEADENGKVPVTNADIRNRQFNDTSNLQEPIDHSKISEISTSKINDESLSKDKKTQANINDDNLRTKPSKEKTQVKSDTENVPDANESHKVQAGESSDDPESVKKLKVVPINEYIISKDQVVKPQNNKTNKSHTNDNEIANKNQNIKHPRTGTLKFGESGVPHGLITILKNLSKENAVEATEDIINLNKLDSDEHVPFGKENQVNRNTIDTQKDENEGSDARANEAVLAVGDDAKTISDNRVDSANAHIKDNLPTDLKKTKQSTIKNLNDTNTSVAKYTKDDKNSKPINDSTNAIKDDKNSKNNGLSLQQILHNLFKRRDDDDDDQSDESIEHTTIRAEKEDQIEVHSDNIDNHTDNNDTETTEKNIEKQSERQIDESLERKTERPVQKDAASKENIEKDIEKDTKELLKPSVENETLLNIDEQHGSDENSKSVPTDPEEEPFMAVGFVARGTSDKTMNWDTFLHSFFGDFLKTAVNQQPVNSAKVITA